jgi:hypothetical protein
VFRLLLTNRTMAKYDDKLERIARIFSYIANI